MCQYFLYCRAEFKSFQVDILYSINIKRIGCLEDQSFGQCPTISYRFHYQYIGSAWNCQGCTSFVKTKGLKNIDNVGAYLTAYLGDMDFDEAVESGFNPSGLETKIIENTDENGKKTKKAIVKGARLHLYPPKFNIYRCSRGIKKPDVSYMPYSKAKKVVGDLTPTFERSVEISDDETGFNNTTYTSQFNKKRK